MAELSLTSEFSAPPERVWQVFDSDEFEALLAKESGLIKTRIEDREEGGIRIARIRVERIKPLPRIAAKALKADKLVYIQTERFDAADSALDWTVELPSLGDRVSVAGRTVVLPTRAGGSRRELRGQVTIRVPVVGGTLERRVAQDFQKTAARAIELARGLM